MRKFATLLLLALLLFNLVGYRMLFDLVQQRSAAALEASLDKDQYNQADLITLKIPLHLPYQNDHNDFERVSGSIHWKGKIYKYVKRKIVDNEVILFCIADKKAMQVESARNNYFKATNDLSADRNSRKESSSKHILQLSFSDYDRTATADALATATLQSFYPVPPFDNGLPNAPAALPDQPPELV